MRGWARHISCNFARQPFDEIKTRIFHHRDYLFFNFFVIDGIFETVGFAGLTEVGVKNDIDKHILFLRAFPVVDADDTLQQQVGDSYFVEFSSTCIHKYYP